MLNKKHVAMFVGIYALVRVFSFFFAPTTTLQAGSMFNTFVALILLTTIIILLLKNRPEGWYLIALEIILGGGGNFLNIGSITLRTIVLVFSISIFFGKKIWRKELVSYLKQERRAIMCIGLLVSVAVAGSLIGQYYGHSRLLIIPDLIPYAFLLYYFPLKQLLQDDCFVTMVQHAIPAALIGNALFTLFALLGFSSHLFILQDTFYHWFRDIAGGKITALPFNYFRIVLNEQLLLIPIMVYLISKIIDKKNLKLYIPLMAVTLFILSTNLTRIYCIALTAGALTLVRRDIIKRWFVVCSGVIIGFLAILVVLHTILSGGKSLGLELIGLRLNSIVSPSIEDSSLSRLLLLAPIKEKIKSHPFIGNGLGDTITVYSPVFKKTVTTPQYDWGYLEILGELGLVGFVIWTKFITTLFLKIKKEKLPTWQFGSLVALLVINITSPALFHVMGILWLVCLLAI